MNQCGFIGNIVKDPVITNTQGGVKKTVILIAVNRRHKESDGTRKSDFINIVVWREMAENVCKYLSKGSKVYVRAHYQTDKITAGSETKYLSSFVADDVEFLDPPKGRDNDNNAETSSDGVEVDEENLPF